MIKILRGELFSEGVFELCTRIVRDGHATADDLAALRLTNALRGSECAERDRRLNRIDDLFTADFLTRYVLWKLGEDGKPSHDVPATAAHHFSEDRSTTLMPARVQA